MEDDDEIRPPAGMIRPGGGGGGGQQQRPQGGGQQQRPPNGGGGGGGGNKVGKGSKTMVYGILIVIGYVLFHSGVLTTGSDLMTLVAAAAIAALAVTLGARWLDAGVKRIEPLEVFTAGFIFAMLVYIAGSFQWAVQLSTIAAIMRLLYIAFRTSLKVVDLDMEEVVAGTDLPIVFLFLASKYPMAGQGVSAISTLITAIFSMVHQITGF